MKKLTFIALIASVAAGGAIVASQFLSSKRNDRLCHAIQRYEQRQYGFQKQNQQAFSGQLKTIAKTFGLTVAQLKAIQRKQLTQIKPEPCDQILAGGARQERLHARKVARARLTRRRESPRVIVYKPAERRTIARIKPQRFQMIPKPAYHVQQAPPIPVASQAPQNPPTLLDPLCPVLHFLVTC